MQNSLLELQKVMTAKPVDPFSLVGVDGNAFSVIGYVVRECKKAGWTRQERELYTTLAMSGSYEQLLNLSIAISTALPVTLED